MLQYAQLVNVAPVLYRLAVGETEDVHLVPGNLLAGRSDTQECSSVRATRCCVMHHLVSLGYFHIDRVVNIGKCGAKHGDELFVTLAARRQTRRWEVIIGIGGDHFIEYGFVTLVKGLERNAAAQSLNVFGC